MQDEMFRKWLEKRYTSKKVVSDKLSRCRRVEKLFNINLDKIKNNKAYDQLLSDINHNLEEKVDKNINFVLCKSNFRNALKLYKQFLKI